MCVVYKCGVKTGFGSEILYNDIGNKNIF